MRVFVLLLLVLVLNTQAEVRVSTGLEVFLKKYSHIVKGKRVGLITNPTGVDRHLRASVDLLKANPNVNLTALFAPEHGIRGDLKAGEHVKGGRDPKTGLPVFSLYGGKDHKPQKVHLDQVDVLIYDIQDVGSRAYTYIWSLAEAMKASADHGKTVIVLDRPNVYGAWQVDGPIVDQKNISFIGLYPIPRVYGMTVGELARLLNKEYDLNCRLVIVPMEGYRRGMTWEMTGLPWVPASPNIPNVESAQLFAATGALGVLGGGCEIGLGINLPFQTVASQYINADKMAHDMNTLRLPGIRFRQIHYIPHRGAYKGKKLQGVQLHVIDARSFQPATTEMALIWYLNRTYPTKFVWNRWQHKTYYQSLDKALGMTSVRNALKAGKDFRSIKRTYSTQVNRFKAQRAKYLIYR